MTGVVAGAGLCPAEQNMVGVGVFRDLEHRIFAGARPMMVRGRVAFWTACNLLAFPSNDATFSARPLTKCQDCARAHPKDAQRLPPPTPSAPASREFGIMTGQLRTAEAIAP
ncbi:hypothetical protein [Saccharopolyspora phatthalungensis]|uniref:Uncharacterized protein n=1 Tax=Saccharopolyspora phatthalungensis TaxID=664693 RepID=A0A840QG53_9PSEU|nr:hypothetical protein [Saccharopolyspora phatthalungensis]MBB5159077.1 hypothetical protein [Saccharopolyspora phatthalungensis]